MSSAIQRAARRAAGIACFLGLAAVCTFAADAPDWLLKCAALPTPGYAAGAPALVLADDYAIDIDLKGRRSTFRRYAVRVLAKGGESYARASVGYLAGRDTAKGHGAWLVRGGKVVKPRGSRDWIDEAVDMEAAFSEYRAKTVSYADLALPGDVFGYEARVQGGLLFAAVMNVWQSSLPTLREQLEVTLPAGWDLAAEVAGERHLDHARTSDGRTWSWVLRDRPYRPDEPYAPDDNWFDARVFATFQLPDTSQPLGLDTFQRWSAVAAYYEKLSEGQCDRDEALTATVQRLTSGVDDQLDRIRAIARHVQELRYVSINRGIGLGFGFRPRRATEVHSKGWGDCKDKANLMCAMLREIGVTAHLATAHTEWGRLVSPDWPSPQQFNHAIVAIRVDDSVDLPAAVATGRFGRVLFFDATHEYTVLGDLPLPLQGSKVHIEVAGSDELVTLPEIPFEQNRRIDRIMRVVLAPDGSVVGTGAFTGDGQAASSLRGLVRRRSTRELEEYVANILGNALRGAVVKDVKFTDDRTANRSELKFEFSAPRLLQYLPGDLALVKLDFFNRAGVPAFPEKTRRLPIDFDGLRLREVVELTLPEGLAVEEVPEKTVLECPFGSYDNHFEVGDGVLRFERVLELPPARIPTDEYSKVRQFLMDVGRADRVSAVLRMGGS